MVVKSSGDYDLPFGATLRRLRVGAGLSQEDLALEAGIQRNFVSLIELGRNQPTITTVCKLARALGLKASELIAETERAANRRSPARGTRP